MKFSKTGNTLQVVGRLDPGQVGLNEVLSVILDVLDDAMPRPFRRRQRVSDVV